MENLIKKFKKQGTVTLINKLAKASGDDLLAAEIVLISRNQPFQAKSDVKALVQYSGKTEEELIDLGYLANPKAQPKRVQKKANPLALTDAEYHFLSAIVNSDYQDKDSPVGNPVWAITPEDLNYKVIGNGARFAGTIKKLINREFITTDFVPQLEKGKVESTMTLTARGYEAYQSKDLISFKGVKKINKDLDEEELEDLKEEAFRLKKELFGKYVKFNNNVTNLPMVGLVTGTKLDKRSGYIFLNIRVGKSKYNKRPKAVEITEKEPNWVQMERNARELKKNLKKKDSAPKNQVNQMNELNDIH